MFLCLKKLLCYYVFNHYFVFHTQTKKATPISSQMIVFILIT